jgi:hypothetical protein
LFLTIEEYVVENSGGEHRTSELTGGNFGELVGF